MFHSSLSTFERTLSVTRDEGPRPIWHHPFEEGVAAAETGMSKDDNPYAPDTSAHSDWQAGYESATDAHEATELDCE
jgi:hypothetical protein